MVTYLTAGAQKTSFADRTNFNVGNWQAKMLPVLSLLRQNGSDQVAAKSLIDLVKELQDELEQQDVCNLPPEAAKQGETFFFDGRDHHWGNAGDLRFVVYSQAVSREVLGKWCTDVALQSRVLTTFYSAETVVDRRTIANPEFLYRLWLFSSSDVLDIESDKIAHQAEQMWETLSDLAELSLRAREPTWPSAVCQCCVRNDTTLVHCKRPPGKLCWIGAIHADCMTPGKKRWKCKSCMSGK